jgi:signal transduction histidine kinase
MTTSTAPPLPPSLYDTLLRLAPVNVFLFDRDLICRYAAPMGDALFGRPRESLLGLPAAEVWPPAATSLHPVLERAVRRGSRWQDPSYHFTHDAGGTRQCWAILIEPITAADFRGVFVGWSDVRREVDERERLQAELRGRRQQASERNAAVTELISDLRNLITPISGYLQVIARRPWMLGTRTAAEVINSIVLPRISHLLAAVDRLDRPPIHERRP